MCSLERGQGLSRAGRMPDIAILVGVLDLVDNFLYGIELIGAQDHQASLSFVQNHIFADDLSQRAFVEKEVGKHVQVVERPVFGIRPVEGEFVAAVGVIGKIAGIHTIRDHEDLNVVEQPVERDFVVALDLVISLLQLHPSLF